MLHIDLLMPLINLFLVFTTGYMNKIDQIQKKDIWEYIIYKFMLLGIALQIV